MSDWPAVACAPDLEGLGMALSRRLHAVQAAVRRLDGMDGRTVDRPAPGRDDTREFVLRALRTAADRDNDVILRAVAGGVCDAEALSEHTGRPRFALWEAVSDLVQVGLLERDPAAGRIRLTGAGLAVLTLVDHIVAAGGSP